MLIDIAHHTAPDPPAHAQARRLRHAYRALYRKVGPHLAGRDILRHGLLVHGQARDASNRHLARSIRVLRRLAHPAPVIPAQTASTPTITAPISTGGLPACASESGTNYSTGPANTNPSTGATGRYQEMPMHRAKGGLCAGIDLSPNGQDRCAAKIYAAQGAGAWVGCSG